MIIRPRRLRRTPEIRNLVRESSLSVNDLVQPLFVKNGKGIKEPIPSMPGQHHFSEDTLVGEVKELMGLGIRSIILFGLPEKKDSTGSSAFDDDEAVQRSVRAIKSKYPDMVVITDVCLCEYTDHGHCGIIENGSVHNDSTLEILAKTALSHVNAGADFVAPSDMMDGRVAAIRALLDSNGFYDSGIISYAVKYASAFYGPFREAAESAPEFGDRRGYQMDPGNSAEAVKEALLDIKEGADMIIVKPALPYLDIISRVKEKCLLPVCAYHVSGEYSMIKAAEERGWVDGKRMMMESLLSIKRAGAKIIFTYFAKEAAETLNR
ncbi:MAG: porphobilinogen synthase [Deltaproteobacteria bacterium]|nr:porphobilinogen synthase [Deltaproteobacteria bacterium]